jgi:hypothetical protein
MDSDAMMNHTGTVYQALDVLAEAVRPIRARKNVVLFSPGIADREEAVFGGMLSSRSRYLDPALHSLNTSNVSVYGVQLQRNADTTPLFHQRLEEISDSTGGHYFRLNVSFIPALQQVERTNNGYYLLSYRSRASRTPCSRATTRRSWVCSTSPAVCNETSASSVSRKAFCTVSS